MLTLWALSLAACGDTAGADSTDTANGDSTPTTETGDTGPRTDTDTATTSDSGETGESPDLLLEDWAFAALLGSQSRAEAAYSVAAAGDFDGDGVQDVVLGAPEDDLGENGAGGVHAAYGPFSGVATLDDAADFVRGVEALDGSGLAVAGPGDLDGDGVADLVVGLYWGFDVEILCGGQPKRVSLDEACLAITGVDGGGFGETLAAPGDVGGDGHADLLIGSPGSDLADFNAGTAYLFHGPISAGTTSDDAHATFVNDHAYEFATYGHGLAGDGDVNGDGFNDVLIGAPGIVHESGSAGRAFLFYGPSTGVRLTPDADETHDEPWFGDGQVVELAADLDGDGFDDVVIGANFRYDATYPLIQVYAGGTSGAGLDSGAATARIFDPEAIRSHDYQGRSLGDHDGDGDDELGVAGPNWIRVFEGPLVGTLDVEDADLALTTPDYYPVLANAGDLDSDGIDDLIVGLPYLDELATDAGGAYLLSGADL